MRLSQLNKFINSFNEKNFSLNISYINIETYKISNIQKFKIFLEYIRPLHFYQKELNFLLNSELYQTTSDMLHVTDKTSKNIEEYARYLTTSFNALSMVLPNLTPKENDYSIDIKLPKPTDFSSLNTTLQTIDKIISQVIIHDEIDGSLNVNHWEYGSYWIELIVGSQAAVSLIAGIAWSSAVIAKKRVEVKIFEEQLRKLTIKNDSLEDVATAQKSSINKLINDEAIGLFSQHFNNEDNEQRERIKLAIREFATLIQNGAEIHPSLETPENVKNLFPDYKQLKSIESQVTKQIEDKS